MAKHRFCNLIVTLWHLKLPIPIIDDIDFILLGVLTLSLLVLRSYNEPRGLSDTAATCLSRVVH